MGIMQTCCCCHLSVRKGSYVSAVYTILYFLAFALLTGNLTYMEIRNWQQGNETSLGSPEISHENNLTSTSATGTHRTSMMITKGTTLDENYEDTNFSTRDDHRYGHTQSPPFSVVLLLLDLTCEVAGFFASFLLIRGLRQESKMLLVPWMIVVPAHTLIDAYTAFDIVIAFIIARYNGHDHGEHSFGILLFFTVTVSVASVINIYALLCVVSQYQEYCSGRGTAAHEAMLLNSGTVRYTSAGERVSTCPYQKSDIWCDDLVFSKSKNRGEGQGGNGRNAGSSTSGTTGNKNKIPTVRFENETSSSSGDSAEPRHRFLGKKSNNDPCGRNLIVPNSNRSGHSTPTLMEEQSTTAESIEEL